MLDSVYNLIFGCRHRRTTFPLTPAGKSRSEPGETYVVCLDCGKQFVYDWENMRLGGPADLSAAHDGGQPEPQRVPARKRSNLRYVAIASALPVAWAIRSAIKSRKKAKSGKGHEHAESDHHENTQTPGTT
ncbi:MAG TPA: hypothetical protein VJN43_23155 [Bryobacteraceae bacterium]|nr:hypothetical protein [Bryobacteraceae bacterium]